MIFIYIIDGYFDDVSFRSLGLRVCEFDGNSYNVSLGARLNYQTSKVEGTHKRHFHSSTYDEVITFQLQLCRLSHNMTEEIGNYELGKLNRTFVHESGYKKLELITDNYEHIVFYANAQLYKIEVANVTRGIMLEFETNSPFCYAPKKTETAILDQSSDYQFCIYDMSDRIGYQYPTITIRCLESGNLKLHNTLSNQTLEINNCTLGEVINIDCENQIISTFPDTHKVYNDFNFVFPKIMNKQFERDNTFISNMAIEITIEYDTVRLIGGVS